MAQTAANLLEHVLPRVPLRQFVLTFPFELRTRLAYDGALLGTASRIVVDSILGFYRRRIGGGGTRSPSKGGAVTVVQRLSADLRLNPHLHIVALDGVFVAGPGGTPVFQPLPELATRDVADLVQVVRARVVRLLIHQGVVEDDDTLTVLTDDIAEREPALARLAAAAVSGLAPAGPERRNGLHPVTLRGRRHIQSTAPLCATDLGFSLHAATTAAAEDERGREALVRYILRPPVAQERLELLPDDLVRIHLRRPFADGTVAVDLDPLSLLCRLCAAVPPPRFNTVRYAGVLAAASSWRALVVPPPPEPTPHHHPGSTTAAKAPTHRSVWRPWHELLKRTFDVDLQACSRCGGHMKLKAILTGSESTQRLLRSMGEPTDPPRRAPARDPPTYKSRVLRRQRR
jgi:hypothetical protein